MTKLVLDAARSRLRIRTFAEGMFARLAHDLELTCGGLSGAAERGVAPARDPREANGTAKLDVPIARIEVSGTVKDGRLDPRGLSASDREDVLAKMQRDVFHARDAGAVVRVEATLEGGEMRVKVLPPNGRALERSASVRLAPEGDGIRASGTLELSLAGLGSDVVKGPMNAFRVKDRVEVDFEVVFAPVSVDPMMARAPLGSESP